MVLSHPSLVILLAGVAVMMFGMSIASDSLQKLAANPVRDLLGRMANRHYLTILVGVVLTILLQSSGAVTSMLVGLGSAGVITLSEVMGVIIGSAIGTTFTVQLISFNVAQYGLGIFTLAFVGYFASKKRTVRNVSGAIMGFGLIFFGIELIGQGTKIFLELDFMVKGFTYLSHYPIAAFLVATTFSAFVHSSAVTIGFAMGLASSGVISLYDALFWVYGANVGTTFTALLAAVGGNHVGKQVAWAHFFYKIISVAIFSLISEPFSRWVASANVTRDIANVHTVYNIFAAIAFYPFIGLGAKVIEKLMPRPDSEREFKVQFIDRATYQSATLALGYAKRELLRMGDMVVEMIRSSIQLYEGDDPELVDKIRAMDTRVDMLHKEINMFLLDYANESEVGVDKKVIQMISFGSDLESAADVVDNNIVELAQKMNALKLTFSTVGWKEIQELHAKVLKVAELSLSCFQMEDASLADEVIELKRQVRMAERQMRESHIDRLGRGLKESINTSSVHLDTLGDYRRIVGLFSNHLYRYREK